MKNPDEKLNGVDEKPAEKGMKKTCVFSIVNNGSRGTYFFHAIFHAIHFVFSSTPVRVTNQFLIHPSWLVFHPPHSGSQIGFSSSFSSTPLGWFFIHPGVGRAVFQRQCEGVVVGRRPGIEKRLG